MSANFIEPSTAVWNRQVEVSAKETERSFQNESKDGQQISS